MPLELKSKRVIFTFLGMYDFFCNQAIVILDLEFEILVAFGAWRYGISSFYLDILCNLKKQYIPKIYLSKVYAASKK